MIQSVTDVAVSGAMTLLPVAGVAIHLRVGRCWRDL